MKYPVYLGRDDARSADPVIGLLGRAKDEGEAISLARAAMKLLEADPDRVVAAELADVEVYKGVSRASCEDRRRLMMRTRHLQFDDFFIYPGWGGSILTLHCWIACIEEDIHGQA